MEVHAQFACGVAPNDPKTVAFKPTAAKDYGINDLAARWVGVVEAFLPLLTAIVQPDTFFKNLSGDEHFLPSVKTQMDAMLSATQVAGKHAVFIDMVAPS